MKLQKETNADKATHGRWYDDACGTAFGLELLGERWSLLIVRELMLGPRRFSDLRSALPGISAKVLTERLATLESAGVLQRAHLTDPVPAKLYELTEWGHAAEPVIQELGRWAARSTMHNPTLPLSPAAFMMSLRTMVDRQKLEKLSGSVGFEIGQASFVARLEGDLPIRRGATRKCDTIFRAPAASPLAGMFYRDLPLDTAEAELSVAVEGDRELAGRFTALFSLPPKIA
ncbi:transcriptional regulator [Altererythrobacter aurantiacus]|uniref:Transcriptional regulator n=1 Tax=Parapontixanthobacter aurantiacus TaxID=1463599 RepID=A0A844ZD51_9SPHN|nr:helix-turn-helix domain-containing protein [Parapontixanthobacter aurantiacus]MXO84850.1 transcriptional regulator [Parapontixanthobacter aurantiacus]